MMNGTDDSFENLLEEFDPSNFKIQNTNLRSFYENRINSSRKSEGRYSTKQL